MEQKGDEEGRIILYDKSCEKENRTKCLTCKEEYPYLIKPLFKCYNNCPDKYYLLEKEEGKECLECQSPCLTCLGKENNCTGCIEGYYLENNSCVGECSEGYELNEELKRCYPIIFLNDTRFNDSFIYRNISTPTPYDVYINHNFCVFEYLPSNSCFVLLKMHLKNLLR